MLALVVGNAAAAAQDRTLDVLTVAIPDDMISDDPLRHTRHPWTMAIHDAVFARLLAAEEGSFSPALADSFWTLDARTWTFELNPNWNSPASTALPKDSLERYFRRLIPSAGIGGYPAPARERLSNVQSVRLDGNRLTFVLEEPDPTFLARIAVEAVAGLDASDRVMPSGAYAIARWERGNRVVLERRADSDFDGPQSIVFEVVPSAEARLQMVLTGKADIALGLPPGAYWRLRSSRTARPALVLQSRVHFIEFDATRPPFNDRRVRMAMNLAVDTEAMIAQLMQDEAVPVATLLSPVTFGYDPSVPAYGHDPIRARELLAEAGYPSGFAMELDAPAAKLRIANAYASMLQSVGIDVTVRSWPSWQSLRNEIALGRRQAWLGEWGNSSRDPATAIIPKLHSKGEANYGGYSDSTLDALLDYAESMADPVERLRLYGDIQRYLRHEAAMLYGYAVLDVYGVRVGLDWNPTSLSWNFDKVKLTQSSSAAF